MRPVRVKAGKESEQGYLMFSTPIRYSETGVTNREWLRSSFQMRFGTPNLEA